MPGRDNILSLTVRPLRKPLGAMDYFISQNFLVMKKWLTIAVFCCFAITIWGQCLVTGTINDENGIPLVGANITVIGTRLGAAADDKGRYEIENVPAGVHTIQASFIGYEVLRKKIIIKEGDHHFVEDLQLQERIISVSGLVVRATRANAKTPMTYTNLDKETIEQNNLGQDVPYLLRWTPSAVVTSDGGTGIGYTGIRIRGTDPTRINVTINGIPLNDAESQGVFWVDLPDFVSSTNDIQVQRGVGTSTNGAGAFGASINLNTNQIQKEPYSVVNATVGSFNTLKGNVTFGSGLLGEKFTLDGRLSKITSDGYIDRATADLESFYLSGAYLGKKSSFRLNVFSGHEVTYQAWNGVPADFIDDPELRTFNSAGAERAGTPHDNEVDDYQQTHYQLLYNTQMNPNWNLNLALHYTAGKGFFEQYKAEQSLNNYGIKDFLLKEINWALPVDLGLVNNYFDLEGVSVTTDTVFDTALQENLLKATYALSSTDLIRRRWLDNDFYGATYALNFLSDNNQIEATLGGAYNIYQGRHFGEVIWARNAGESELKHIYYDNDAQKTDFNIFAKLNYQVIYGLNAYIDLQYRRVGYQFLGFNNQLENVDQEDQLHFFNPKFGLLYRIKDKADLYASFGVANREPNRNDYTESPTSSRPKPEQLYNTEVGYRQKWNRAALAINFYHMFYRDQLALNGQINDVGEYSRINIDKSYRLGLELVAGIELFNGLHLQGNATFSQNKVKGFTEFVDTYDESFNWLGQEAIERENTDLAFSPNVMAGGDLTYHVFQKNDNQNLSLSLLGKYVGKQFIDNSSDNKNVIDPYFFSDFRIRYQLKTNFIKEIGLTLLVRNIFDGQFETNAWSYRYNYGESTLVDQGFYPQAGRNVLLGISLGF